MESQPFLPLSSSSPDSPTLLPRRPSLSGRLLNLLPSRASSTALQDLEEGSAPPTFLRRGSVLIGHKNARYDW